MFLIVSNSLHRNKFKYSNHLMFTKFIWNISFHFWSFFSQIKQEYCVNVIHRLIEPKTVIVYFEVLENFEFPPIFIILDFEK